MSPRHHLLLALTASWAIVAGLTLTTPAQATPGSLPAVGVLTTETASVVMADSPVGQSSSTLIDLSRGGTVTADDADQADSVGLGDAVSLGLAAAGPALHQSVDLVIATFPGHDQNWMTTDQASQLIANVQAWYQANTGQNITFTISGAIKTITSAYACQSKNDDRSPTTNLWDAAATLFGHPDSYWYSKNPAELTHLVVLENGNDPDCAGYGGLARMGWAGVGLAQGGAVSVAYNQHATGPKGYDSNTGIAVHELGHNFGLAHSERVICASSTLGIATWDLRQANGCSIREYWDTTEFMGAGAEPGLMSAARKYQLGVLEPSAVISLSQSVTNRSVTLKAVPTPDNTTPQIALITDVLPDATAANPLKGLTYDYAVELRQYPAQSTSSGQSEYGVAVMRLNANELWLYGRTPPVDSWGVDYIPGRMWPGDTFVSFDGLVSVTVVSIDAGTATVSINPTGQVTQPGAAVTVTPTITGLGLPGKALAASVSVPDGWSVSSWQWLRGGVAINGATGWAYALTPADAGTAVSVQVTLTRTGYETSTGTSAAVVVSTTSISGRVTGAGAAVVNISYDNYDCATGVDVRSPDHYSTIQAASDGSFTIPTLAGTCYRILPSATGYTFTVNGSANQAIVPSATTNLAIVASATIGAPVAFTPTIAGVGLPGRTLAASVTVPSGWAISEYQWLRNGVAISGATGWAYALTPTDAGTAVSVRITLTRTGYQTSTGTSAAVTVAGASITGRVTGTGASQVSHVFYDNYDCATGADVTTPDLFGSVVPASDGSFSIPTQAGACYLIRADILGGGVTATVNGAQRAAVLPSGTANVMIVATRL